MLLFASAATHEYQFVQAILVRDQTKGRVKVATFLQPPPGQKGRARASFRTLSS